MILPKVTLTASGRPQLLVSEIERLLLDKVDLEFEGIGGTEGCQTADRYQNGYAVVTSHRVLWIDAGARPAPGRSCCLPLESIHSSSKRVQYGLNLMNPKVRLELKVYVDLRSQPCNMQNSATFRYLQLRCRGEGPDAFNDHLTSAMQALRQQLERQQQRQQQQQQSAQQQMQQPADMGFPRPRVLRALLATHSEHMQAALDWVLAASADPSTDAPWAGPEPSQVSRQELQQLQQLAAMRQQQQQQAPLPGWGLGSVAAASAVGAPASSGAAAGSMWPPAAAAAGSGVLNSSSSSGPAGYSSAGPSTQQQQQQQQQGPGSRVVGVAGIMHREAAKSSATSASLAAAFRDLEALMAMAADMVALAEKFRGVMGPDGSIALNNTNNNNNSAAEGGGSSGEQLLLDADTQLQLIAMGIASPVTKASAGARYHQELSRQLADFLAAPLARAGGVLMLPDVYCLFNRARGSELVSPDDLLQACEAFPHVGLPLRVRKFPSGVIVVQGSQFSDEQLCSSIQRLLQDKAQQQQQQQASTTPGDRYAAASPAAVGVQLGPALSATDVSGALSLPLTLAREALLVAEARGVLCRDDGPEGLRFFANFFMAAQPLAV
ncbi:hypothetical protein OEZ85_008265 [Tetradesmus obliquus]|uniref:Vacuolar protein-sorting-associated protein 36 n=1 Tax=Tetradesmus obliquus TaxID=3088 RepID=A0ABY8TIC6_TETOB|nr:hypothetical protein OEZ85_008265 [Tetradesmus obliquus]